VAEPAGLLTAGELKQRSALPWAVPSRVISPFPRKSSECTLASLLVSKDWHWTPRIAQSLGGLAIVAASLGETERAVVLTAVSSGDAAARYTYSTEPDELERALAPIRRTLGGERVKELQAEGRHSNRRWPMPWKTGRPGKDESLWPINRAPPPLPRFDGASSARSG
jgi:hypothetical protein